MILGKNSLSLAAAVAVLGIGGSLAKAATIVNLGFDTIGNTGFGWTLPSGFINQWDSGYNATHGNDGGPNSGWDIYARASTFDTNQAQKVSATSITGDTIVAGSYTLSYVGATGRTSTPIVVRFSAIDAQTNSVLGSVDLEQVQAFDLYGNHTAYYDSWAVNTLSFTISEGSAAIGNHLKLQFEAVNPTDPEAYFLITNVAATVETPEPASLGLLGLGAVALLRRRK